LSTAASITIPETLRLLDGRFAAFAQGVTEDRYALWLGSAISFDRLPGLKQIIEKVLEHLRSHINPLDADCKYKSALENALTVASITAVERTRCDFGASFSTWPDADALLSRLVNQYSRLLQIEVAGEEDDYLLWEAVNVVAVFADPTKQPDAEHLCVALLVLEGVFSEIASANWDGLIEKAVQDVADNHTTLAVFVRPQDFQQLHGKANLYKFHGCAVKAKSNEALYRPYFTASQAQINGWAQKNAAMADRLQQMIVSRPTLMIGLSAQDPNIQNIFSKAEASVHWPWPGDRPSYVFSTSDLGVDQKSLLQIVYRESMTALNRPDIAGSAAFPAYAKPLLLGLTLYVLAAKLKMLIELAHLPPTFSAADKILLWEGINTCRDQIAEGIGADKFSFLKSFITLSGKAISMFHSGQVPGLPSLYLPLTSSAPQHFQGDATLLSSGLTEAAIAVGVIGLLVQDGKLEIQKSDPGIFGSGAVCFKSTVGSAKVFFAANSNVALRLEANGLVTSSSDTIVIHSFEIVSPSPRSPKAGFGRTGYGARREASISTLISQSKSVSELVQLFRMEVGI